MSEPRVTYICLVCGGIMRPSGVRSIPGREKSVTLAHQVYTRTCIRCGFVQYLDPEEEP